jgi:hypothetical protein
VLLAGLLGGEVEVLDCDRLHAAGCGPVQQPGQGVADLGVAVVGGAGEVVGEAARLTARVAVGVQAARWSAFMSTPTTPSAKAVARGIVRVTGICQEAVTYQRPRSTSWWMRWATARFAVTRSAPSCPRCANTTRPVRTYRPCGALAR